MGVRVGLSEEGQRGKGKGKQVVVSKWLRTSEWESGNGVGRVSGGRGRSGTKGDQNKQKKKKKAPKRCQSVGGGLVVDLR